MTTRGVRRLKEYLAGSEEAARMSAKRRIAAMAPLLSAKLRRQSGTRAAPRAGRGEQGPQQGGAKGSEQSTQKTHSVATATATATTPVSEAVVTYLRRHHRCGASNKFSHTQLRLVSILGGSPAGVSARNLQPPAAEGGDGSDVGTRDKGGSGDGDDVVRVKRVHLPSVTAIADSLAIASLERHYRYECTQPAAPATKAALVEGGVVFVLAEDEALAEELRDELVTRYALHVMLLGDHDVARFPSWPAAVPDNSNSNSNSNNSEDAAATTNTTTNTTTRSTKKATKKSAAASRKRTRSARRGGVEGEDDEGDDGDGNGTQPPSSNRNQQEATAASSAQQDHRDNQNHNSDDKSGDSEAAASAASVVIATAAGFLAVDRRSAVWKFIGAYAIVLRAASPGESALLRQLLLPAHTATARDNKGSSVASNNAAAAAGGGAGGGGGLQPAAMTMAARLAAQRWACLGHCPLACVLATHRAMLVAPALDWLLTLQPVMGGTASGRPYVREASVVTAATAGQRQPTSGDDGTAEPQPTSAAKKGEKTARSAAPVMRDPVTLYHATAEGIERFQFLFGLICGLAPHRGLLVHCASKACCVFLRHALYALDDELPPHVRVLCDCDDAHEGRTMGSSDNAEVMTEAERRELCGAFDATVLANEAAATAAAGDEEDVTATKTSAVLLSCRGLVPREGDIFLQYDLLLDLPSFTQFVSDVLTPGAYRDQTLCVPAQRATADHSREDDGDSNALLVRRVTQIRSRKRSTSPIPLSQPPSSPRAGRNARATSPTPLQGTAEQQQQQQRQQQTVGRTPRTATKYGIIILLFRPCELSRALHCLALTTARHALRLAPLPQPPSRLRYARVASKLRSLHRQTFEFARLSYEAYKATMALYALMSGSEVYDCAQVDLQKVAEEYGYVNTTPVLDLRLRDTAFRPKEDYYKAARQKQAHESSAYRRFAAEHIAPEPTEAHVVDETHTTNRPVRRRRRRHY